MPLIPGWIELKTMLTFPRLAGLSTDAEVILDAIEKSAVKVT
jgi:hypothetical protein